MDHILLLSGEETLKCFNSWTLTDTERNDPDHIWRKFDQQIEPKHNFRVPFVLSKLPTTRSVDDFITRLKLQAQKCDFRDDRESNERVLEQFIAGIRYMELQKELLSAAQDFATEQTLERGRTFEAPIAHMKQLAEAQGTNINTMRTFPIRKCHNCGGVVVPVSTSPGFDRIWDRDNSGPRFDRSRIRLCY